MSNLPEKVFSFSSDERVYASDVNKIVQASRQYPDHDIYCHNHFGWREVQTYVLAASPADASKTYNDYYGEDLSLPEEFDRGDIKST